MHSPPPLSLLAVLALCLGLVFAAAALIAALHWLGARFAGKPSSASPAPHAPDAPQSDRS